MLKEYKYRQDKYVVYMGKNNGTIRYIGTTIQFPLSRFYYHKQHGKDLDFEIVARFRNEKKMLDKEFELIQKYNPSMNKITKRRQNYNVVLTASELECRKWDSTWCQCCLRRHVSPGYKYCYYCSTGR